jgi:ketosteroid isomerase-like protein
VAAPIGAAATAGSGDTPPVSSRNVDLIRTLIPPPETDIAALFRDDELFGAAVGGLREFIDPEIESRANWMGGTRYTGIEGFRKLWLDWLEPWTSYYTRIEELIDAGDRVLVLIRDRGRRRDLDAEIELTASSVWEIRDGRIVRAAFYTDRDDAFAAAGVER